MYSINFFFPIGCLGVGGCPSPGACWAYPRAGPVDDFPIDDLDGSNNIYGEGLPLEDNIHPINDNLGF